jgi:hypothetical protein
VKSIIETREEKKKRIAMDAESKMFMRSLMGEFTGNILGYIDALGVKVDLLTAWKPELESRVAELQTAVCELQRTVLVGQTHVTIDISAAPTTAPVGAGKATTEDLGAARVGAFPGKSGHGSSTTNRGSLLGFFRSPATPPAKVPSECFPKNGRSAVSSVVPFLVQFRQ